MKSRMLRSLWMISPTKRLVSRRMASSSSSSTVGKRFGSGLVRPRMQLLFFGEAEEIVVGHGGPEEVRQARGEFVVVQGTGCGRRRRRVLFDAEEEIGR